MFSKHLCMLLILASTAVLASAQIAAPGEYIVVLNGVRLWYKVAGTAHPLEAPLLYLHGGPGYNSYSLEKSIGTKLEKQVQIIYFDQRGSGRSKRPASKVYSMAALIEDVEALRKHLGVPQLWLMGHSFGGTIALEYAAHYPGHVKNLIIVDGAADLPETFEHWQVEIEQRYPAQWRSALSSPAGQAFGRVTQTDDPCKLAKARFKTEMVALQKVDRQALADLQQFHDQRFRQEQKALDDASGLNNTGELSSAYFTPDSDYVCYRFGAFSRLNMPVLVIGGTYDGAIDVEQMRSLATHLPHAQLDEFTRSAHFPYAEEPGKFAQDVTSFLREGK